MLHTFENKYQELTDEEKCKVPAVEIQQYLVWQRRMLFFVKDNTEKQTDKKKTHTHTHTKIHLQT